MADEQSLFRTAISGFNKDDVLAYIEGINRAATENQDWFDRQTKAMADTIKRLTKENNALKAEGADPALVEQLRAQLEQKEQECEALRQQLAAAQDKIAVPNEQLRTRIEEIIRDRERMLAQIAEYKAEIEQLRAAQAEPSEQAPEEDATAQLAALQSQYDAVRAQLLQTQEQAARQIDELTLQNRQLQSRLSGSGNARTGYTDELRLRESQERVTALERELAGLRAENEQLRAQSALNPDQLRSIYDKSRLYDDIKNNVGRIITEARKRADDMVAQAEADRDEILMQGMDGLTAMQTRLQLMKKQIDQAQKIYADTSISMSGMFNAINDAVNITDNQLIAVLGPIPEPPAQEPQPEPKRPNGNEDVWRTPIL